MQSIKIFLIRHAEPVLPDEKIYLGHLDLPLSSRGLRQAEDLAKGLQNERISRIFCSDLLRARQTAQVLACSQKLEITTSRQLREINMGEWEGKSFEEIQRCNHDEFVKRGRDIVTYCPPGGESFADLRNRVLPYFNKLVETSEENVAIISHKGVLRVILCSLTNLSLDRLFFIKQDYSCVNVLEKDNCRILVKKINQSVYEQNT